MKGFEGKLLVVNLSNKEISEEEIDNSIADKFLGGAGYACKYLYDKIDKNTDPLSPDNPIIISAGPLIGTGVPGAAKIEMLTKSPPSADKEQPRHFIPRASGGSRRFGNMMKRAGYCFDRL